VNYGYRTAAGSLPGAVLLLGRIGLVVYFGKAVFRNTEYIGAGAFAQAAGDTAVAINGNVHQQILLSVFSMCGARRRYVWKCCAVQKNGRRSVRFAEIFIFKFRRT
jgi:hypothetical protein